MFNSKKEEKERNVDKFDKPWLKYYKGNFEHVDYFDGSLYEKILDVSSRFPNNYALEYFGKKYTYKQMINEIDKVAISLNKLGIKENDYVTICMVNCPEAIFTFYAINKIGAIANIIHPLSSENEIKQYLKGTKSTCIFISDFVYYKLKNIKVKKAIVVPIANSMNVVMKTLYNITTKKKNKAHDLQPNTLIWKKFLTKGNDKNIDTFKKKGKDDDAVILYSGGTTGKPKGVILTNLCFNAVSKHCDLMVDNTDPGNSILSYLPIFHGFGLAICIHTPLSIGMKCILIPKLNVKKINKIVEKTKPNFLPVIPSLLEIMVKDKKASKKALKSVLCVLSGGDFLNIDLKTRAEKYLKEHGANAVIRIGYGLTEVTAATCVSLVEDYQKGSIGIPFPDTLYKIVKTNTNITADVNEIGEICICGPTVMKGYLNNQSETYRTIRVHEDGKKWLHTGDLGRMDENGIFYFETRLKRMIISNGCNIYPNYLEEIYNKHPLIETSIVVGIQDDIKQQVAKAIIVLKKNIKLTEEVKNNIIEYAKKNIVKYALPKEYEYVDNLPKTPIGKVDYKKFEDK